MSPSNPTIPSAPISNLFFDEFATVDPPNEGGIFYGGGGRIS